MSDARELFQQEAFFAQTTKQKYLNVEKSAIIWRNFLSALFCRCYWRMLCPTQRLASAGYPLKIVIIRRKMVSARRAPCIAPRAFNFPSPQPPYDNSRKELSHFKSPYIRSTPKKYPNWQILAATLDIAETFINHQIEYFNLQKTTWWGLKLFFDPFSIKRDESQRVNLIFNLMHWIRTCMWGIVQRLKIPSVSSMLSVHRCLLHT